MLPLLKETYHKIKVGNRTIEIKAWKTKDEKAYLIAKEQGDLGDKTLFNILIKPCIKDFDETEMNFSTNEEMYIMTKIREISLGNYIVMNFTCPHCKGYNEQELNLDNIVKYTPESWHDVQIDDYTFVFQKNTSNKAKERIEKCETAVEKDFTSIVLSIVEIKKDKEVFDTFTFDELYTFIESLDTKIFDELADEYFGMIDNITMEWETKCMLCDKEVQGNLETIPNFLWD